MSRWTNQEKNEMLAEMHEEIFAGSTFLNGEHQDCGLCDQDIWLDEWTLYPNTCRVLRMLHQLGGYHKESELVKKYGHTGKGDFARLRVRGLIIENDNKRAGTNVKAGEYCISPKGSRFIRGEITLPKHFAIYNKDLYAEWGEPVTFEECLGEPFDLNEHLERAA